MFELVTASPFRIHKIFCLAIKLSGRSFNPHYVGMAQLFAIFYQLGKRWD